MKKTLPPLGDAPVPAPLRDDEDAVDFVDPGVVIDLPPIDFLRQRIEATLAPCTMDQARTIYYHLMGHIFGTTIRTGQCRIAPGLGTLYTTLLSAPSGTPDALPVPVIRYREGDAVKVMLGKPDKYPDRKQPPRAVREGEPL